MPEPSKIVIRCKVNGAPREFETYPLARLLDVLRETGLTGTKEGCGEGECGACSVLLDGELVNSCLLPAAHAAGTNIITIESLAPGERLNVVQKAFVECGGTQCGICTPGFVLASYDLLRRNPRPTLDEVRAGLAGNLCRCTGYTRIYEAVLAAAKAETR